MLKVTASEIVGEIKRSKRIYEIFDEAEKILEFFVEREIYKKQLEQDIHQLNEESKVLEVKISEQMVHSAEIQNDLEDRMKKVDTTVERKQQEVIAMVGNAAIEAEKLISSAKVQVVLLHQAIEETKIAYKMALDELRGVQDQIRVAKNDLEKVKTKFLKSFN
jgi:hypothetical protein